MTATPRGAAENKTTPAGERGDDITLVVVAHDNTEILAWQARNSAALPTITVNNGPQATGEAARALGHTVLEPGCNLGFGAGVMAGVRAARTPFALVLNADAAAPTEAVNALRAAADRYTDAFVFMPRQISRGVPFLRHSSALTERTPRQHRRVPTGDACVPWLSGAAFLVRIDAFQVFGGFDEKIFLYFEDDDLSIRLQKARKPLVYVHDAVVVHSGDASSASPSRALRRLKAEAAGWSQDYVARKHGLADVPFGRLALSAAVSLASGRLQKAEREVWRIRGATRSRRGLPSPRV